MSTFTFVATYNAAAYTGATPVLVRSRRRVDSWCIDADLVLEELERRDRTGRLPAAVIAVDLYGQCADYDRFASRCRELGVLVIEDSAEAIGRPTEVAPPARSATWAYSVSTETS